MFADLKAAVLDELENGTHTEAFADGARFTLNEAARMSWPTIPTCTNCGSDGFTCGGCGALVDAAAAPRPVVDRDAVAKALVTFGADVRTDHGEPAVLLGAAVDAVMELARPMPTREQIAAALSACAPYKAIDEWPDDYRNRQADAVLALFTGAES